MLESGSKQWNEISRLRALRLLAFFAVARGPFYVLSSAEAGGILCAHNLDYSARCICFILRSR